MFGKSYDAWLKLGGIALVVYCLTQVTNIFLPIIVSIVISFVLNPLVNALTTWSWGAKRQTLPRGIAVLLAFLLTVGAIAIASTFVLLPFIREFDRFVVELPGLILKIQDIAAALSLQVSAVQLPANINGLIDQSIASAASFSADVARRIFTALLGFAGRIVELVVVPVLTYYFLKDWQLLRDSFISFFSVAARERVHNLIAEMAQVISAYIRGQVMVSIVIGGMVFSGMYVLGVEYPLVLGLLATITETIPIVGPIIGAVPAVMLAYLLSPALAVKVIVFYIVIHQIENQIVVPNIMGHTIALHPVLIIISLLIGAQLYGIIGMMLAVPAAALLRVLVKELYHTTGER